MNVWAPTPRTPKSIEDIVIDMSWGRINLFKADETVINSFETQINLGRTFTVKQGALAVKLCQKYRNSLVALYGPSVEIIIDGPIFQSPLREYTPPVKSITVGQGSKAKISVSFPYDERIVKIIKEFAVKHPSESAVWDQEEKIWKFSLTEGSVNWLGNNLVPLGFTVDERFLEFFEKIHEILENMEAYAPSMAVVDGMPVFKNTHPSIPLPANDKILDALFLAKLYAIDVWDENCENFINSPEISPITRKFLKKEIGHEMTVKAREHELECFDQLINSIESIMVVIPEHQELGYLKKWHKYLFSLGYTENDMTVMFRVDNITNKAFNDYVRDNKLNTPIRKDMKVVFVSRRIKKPLVKSGIDFGLVISCDPLGSHHALKKILDDKYNSIVYVDRLEENETL